MTVDELNTLFEKVLALGGESAEMLEHLGAIRDGWVEAAPPPAQAADTVSKEKYDDLYNKYRERFFAGDKPPAQGDVPPTEPIEVDEPTIEDLFNKKEK